MKRFQKNNYIVFCFLVFSFCFSNITLASSYDDKIISEIQNFSPDSIYNPEIDINLTEKDLEISKIKILPDNVFYFLNDIKHWGEVTFALNKNNQNNTLFKISSEKLKELEKCIQLSADKCTQNGLYNYDTSKNNIYNKINKLDNQTKAVLLTSITKLEINHFILLNELKSNSEIKELDVLIENNLQNYSKFIKSISDNITFKKNIKLSIEEKNNQKLRYILVNQFLESFKNYLNIEKREIINQIISENNTELIKNINLINIDKLDKTLQYYFYKTKFKNIFEEISTIDNLYKLQDQVEESPNKENIKIAILNTKQIPISLFNQQIEQLDIKESNIKLEQMFNTGEIQQTNLIELLNKYNNGKKDIKTYQLKEISDKNLLLLYKKAETIIDSVQKEKYLNETLDQISPENKDLALKILNTIEIDNSNDINIKIIVERIKEQRDLTEPDKITGENNIICPFVYSPVCGSNGTVYNNKCLADKAETKVLYQGECKILENDKLKEITAKELSTGWYYGDPTQKKPGTPTTWVNIDSETRSAKWIDPKKITNLKGITE